jgi:histidyl-tRNA synthetase
MGLPDGHPEKDGVLVDIDNLVEEVKGRIARKAELDAVTVQAKGLKVSSEQPADVVEPAVAPGEA